MILLVRWEPFLREFNTLSRRLNRMLEPSWEEEQREFLGTWYPAVDIRDTGNELVLEAELPGMDKKDIEIRVENNVLTLQGQRKREREVKDEGYYRSERAFGSFSRSFTLPSSVSADKIQAAYKDGILKVQIPKTEEAKPRQIEVKVS